MCLWCIYDTVTAKNTFIVLYYRLYWNKFSQSVIATTKILQTKQKKKKKKSTKHNFDEFEQCKLQGIDSEHSKYALCEIPIIDSHTNNQRRRHVPGCLVCGIVSPFKVLSCMSTLVSAFQVYGKSKRKFGPDSVDRLRLWFGA